MTLRIAARLLLLLGGGLGMAVAPRGQGEPWVSDRYVHEAWTAVDGLPVNAVNDLVQAPDGYLWLATYDGLVRFDGVRFTVFSVSNTPGLPSNRITCLYKTRDGRLWLVTAQGHLVRFDGRTFQAYGPFDGPLSIYEDDGGTLWIGASNHVYRVGPTHSDLVLAARAPSPISSLLVDASGTLWAGSEAGLQRMKDGQWTTAFTHASGPVLALYADEQEPGAIWVGVQSRLFRLRDSRLEALPGSGALHEVRSVFRDDQGRLGGYAREGYFSYQDGRFQLLRPADTHISNPWSFRDPWPFQGLVMDAEEHRWVINGQRLYEDGQPIFELAVPLTGALRDHEGSLWVATNTRGLHRLKPSLFTTYGEREGLASENVYGLFAESRETLWIATLDGWVSRLHEGRITNFTNGEVRTAWTVLMDRHGTLWAGGPSGLWRCRPPALEAREGEMPCAYVDLSLGAERTVRALHEDQDGTLWVGATTGLYRLRDGVWKRFTTSDGLPHDTILFLYKDGDGALWAATYGGVARYRDGRFEHFTTADGLSSNHVRAVYMDREGFLWVGTEDQGLNRLDLSGAARLQDAEVTVYRQDDGLLDDGLHAILEDREGRFWMSTNQGLFWMDRADLEAFAEGRLPRLHAKVYDERDGMRNREANGGVQAPALQTPDGRLWFATQGGLVAIDPQAIRPNEQPPPVAIEEVLVAGRPYPVQDGVVTLPPSARDFDVAYTGLSFAAPDLMRFRYRLEGLHEAWTDVDRRMAFFTNVPPGTYTFHVTASNNDGYWNESGATLTVVLQPYLYETGWFYGLGVLSVLVLAGLGYRRRIRRVERRARELEGLVAERTEALAHEKETVAEQAAHLRRLDAFKSRFFANLSHEFRTPLTLIIGPLQRALSGDLGPLPPAFESEGHLMLRNSRRLQRLINQILDLARLEDGNQHVDAAPHDLVLFVGDLTEAFAPLARQNEVALTYAPACPNCVVAFDPDLLEKVVINLLSNAFKVTGPGDAVTVSVAREGEQAVVRVQDTGPGIPPDKQPVLFDRFYQVDASTTRAQEGSGIGLALAKELAELHGGTLAVESEVGVGSTFILRIPTTSAFAAPGSGDGTGAPPPGVPVLDGIEAASAAATRIEARPRPDGEPEASADDEDRTTVLVVEDNADMRAFIVSVLGEAYRVVEATHGVHGLAQARAHLPDLIVSDVMMPEMDGLALNRALKADPALDCIPVILLTARAEVEDQVEGYETGADAYVTKPFEAAVLRAQVRALLDARLRLRVRYSDPATPPPATGAQAPPSDSPFVADVRRIVEARLADPALTMEDLAEAVHLSYVQFYRRVRDEAGTTPSEFVRTLRLERAAVLLAEQAGTVSEIAYAVGFNSLSYFSRCFRAHAGVTPSGYAARV